MGRPRHVRCDLPAAGAEEAHEGQGGSRLPRSTALAWPRQRRRGTRVAELLESGAQHHRPAAGALSLPARRFPPPWSVEETEACFIVRDANGQALAYVRSRARVQRATRTSLPHQIHCSPL